MKILYFVDHLRPNGTQHVLQQLVEGLTERGHDQAVVCLNDSWDGLVVAGLGEAGAEVRIVSKLALVSGIGLVTTWRWLRREQFDVAVTLLFVADVVGRLLARAAGVPRIISSIRARNIHYAGWQRWLVRRTMAWADAVVLNSAYVRDFAIAEEGAHPARLCVIPSGVETEEYSEPMSRAELCAVFDLSPARYLVGSVGRLTYQKGFDVLLQALALVATPDVHLLLIGAGEEEQNLRAQATALDRERQVHFAGYRRDVPRLLGALDLYVHPARFEGMPNALLEAMASRCPIVATAVDGNRELIEDGVHGWLVPAEDSAALAQVIQAALSTPMEAWRRAASAQERAATQFSVDTMVEAWERVLAGAIPKGSAAHRSAHHQSF